MWSEDYTTPSVLRSANASLSGTPRALLAIWLRPTAPDPTPREGIVGARTGVRLLSDQRLVHYR